jgi:hypothetical protein
MVEIHVSSDVLDIQVQGAHKFWALKSSLQVPLSDVQSVRHDPERASSAWPGLRVPGTHIPFVRSVVTVIVARYARLRSHVRRKPYRRHPTARHLHIAR